MIGTMKDVAVECLKHPSRSSVWEPRSRRYLCPRSEEFARTVQLISAETPRVVRDSSRPPIDPRFKLIFLTSAVGTLLFMGICVALHLLTDGQPPPAMGKFIDGLFDLVKIGFGAVVGLLGGKALSKNAED